MRGWVVEEMQRWEKRRLSANSPLLEAVTHSERAWPQVKKKWKLNNRRTKQPIHLSLWWIPAQNTHRSKNPWDSLSFSHKTIISLPALKWKLSWSTITRTVSIRQASNCSSEEIPHWQPDDVTPEKALCHFTETHCSLDNTLSKAVHKVPVQILSRRKHCWTSLTLSSLRLLFSYLGFVWVKNHHLTEMINLLLSPQPRKVLPWAFTISPYLYYPK